MLKIGIECENLEDPKSRWGIGHIVLNLLEEYGRNIELQNKFRLYLYFKKSIPDDEILKNPVFVKRILGFPSFNIFYHILMPIRAMFDRLDAMFFPAYMLPPFYFGKSVVLLTPDVYHAYKHGTLPFRYRLAYGIFTNWAARFATKILAISETSKKEVSRLYKINPAGIFVDYLGINKDNFSRQGPAARATPFADSPDYYLLYIGQMFPRRHAKETILAFEKISPEFPGLKLILIGKDKYNPPVIDNLIRKINTKFGEQRIIHYDYIEKDKEVRKLQKNAKLLIYISDHEAFGLPPVEATGMGTPAIVKDDDLNRELFGNGAFFVKNSENVEEIASVIREGLTNQDKRENITKQYKTFIEKYNWSSFTEKLFDEIARL